VGGGRKYKGSFDRHGNIYWLQGLTGRKEKKQRKKREGKKKKKKKKKKYMNNLKQSTREKQRDSIT